MNELNLNIRHIQTTPKYLQGPDLIYDIGKYVKEYSKNVLIISGNTGINKYGNIISKSLEKENIDFKIELFNGETTYNEANRLSKLAIEMEATAVIAIGGGKVIDTGKAAGFFSKIKVVIVPTIAASDAPCSSVSVMYSEEGNVVGVEYFERNPDLILVDSKIISEAPTRFLRAGIGDALSTYFDAKITYRNGYPNVFGSQVSDTALGLAKLSYNLIKKYGKKAIYSNEMNIVTPELEAIIETTTYLSGVGFENCGISCSHSIHDALTEIKECKSFLHGEKVAFGTLCVIVMEDYNSEELLEFLSLCYDIDLPITLRQLGLTENKEKKIKSVMDIAYQIEEDSVYHMPPYATKESIYGAIILADKIGEEYLKGKYDKN